MITIELIPGDEPGPAKEVLLTVDEHVMIKDPTGRVQVLSPGDVFTIPTSLTWS